MWSTAEQFAQRCARDYDEEENRLRLVEGNDAAKINLERKLRRWEQAAKLATSRMTSSVLGWLTNPLGRFRPLASCDGYTSRTADSCVAASNVPCTRV